MLNFKTVICQLMHLTFLPVLLIYKLKYPIALDVQYDLTYMHRKMITTISLVKSPHIVTNCFSYGENF